MARVFVSHAGEDSVPAGEVHRWLEDDGHDVFLYGDVRDGIAVGVEWEQRLYERLRWADAVVCVVTSSYLVSVWCTAEVVMARARGSRLLPVLVECGVVHPLLVSVQHVDATVDTVEARVRLSEALRRVDAGGGSGWPDGRCPFPGLRPFDTDQHRVFFGRTGEVEQLAALLRSPAERAEAAAVLVVGPSGCGKSSLVRAGLLPVMAHEPGWWVLPAFVPGADPVAALVRELAAAARRLGMGWTVADVRGRVDGPGGLAELADEVLLTVAGPQRRRLLVVVDQFEELLTQTAPDRRARFVELLAPALAGPVQVVATLRPEFLDQVLVSPELAGLPTRTHTLRPLRREALDEVIEGPARLAGIDVDADLVAELVADTESGEALPLLAYTLAELADGVERGGRLLASRYEQLGGVRGALTRQADAALADAVTAGGRGREQVIEELLRLVTVDEQGRPTRNRVRRDELAHPAAAELDRFVARRLLTTDTENGAVVVGVAHEAFLHAWAPLADAIAAASSALRARRGVEQAATGWVEAGRASSRLWERGQLAAALADTGARVKTGGPSRATATPDTRPSPKRLSQWWVFRHRVLVTDRVQVSTAACDFLLTSLRRDRRRRRRSTTILSVLLVLALAAAGVAIRLQGDAVEQQQLATAQRLVAQADATRDTDPKTALLLGLAAQHIHPDRETRASLVNTLTTTRFTNILNRGANSLNRDADSMAFASDGRTLATATLEGALLWDLAEPTRPRRIGEPLTDGISAGSTYPVYSVAFTRDGHTLAAGDEYGSVRLWDLTDPTRPRPIGQPLTDHIGPVNSVAFNRDGHTLATAGQDGSVRLWDLTDPTRPRPIGQPLTGHTLTGHTEAMYSVAFAPDGHTLATAGQDGSVRLWDLTDPTGPRPIEPLTGYGESVHWVVFAPEGHTLAIPSGDGAVLLWDLTDPTRPRSIGQPLTDVAYDAVYSVAFTPDGHTLATASNDNTVRLWDLTDPTRPHRIGQPLTGLTEPVVSMAFAPDGHTLATGSFDGDGSVRLWNLTDPTQRRRIGQPLTGHNEAVNSVTFTRDGRTLATGDDDGTVLLWDLTDPTRPHRIGQPLTGLPGPLNSVAFASDGRALATVQGGGIVLLWDLTDSTRPRPIDHPSDRGFRAVAFVPGGRTLAVVGFNDTVQLWDPTDDPTPPASALDGGVLSLGRPLPSVAVAPDGHTLAVVNLDNTVTLWDLSSITTYIDGQAIFSPAAEIPRFTGRTDATVSVAFAPDGHLLAVVGGLGNTVQVADVTDTSRTGVPGLLSRPLVGHTAAVSSVAFASDGRTLATGDDDGTVLLWDLTDPTQPRPIGQPLIGHTKAVNAVAFASDGRTLATAGADNTVLLWDLTDLNDVREHATERACSMTGGGLSRDEWGMYIPGLEYQDTCAA